MTSTNNSNYFIQFLEYILQFFYDLYYKLASIIKDYKLYTIIGISIIGLSGLIYYLSFKNPYNIMNYIQSSSTITYVALTTFLITMFIYFIHNEDQTNVLNPIIKYLKIVGIILMVYVLVSLFFSTHIISSE